MGVNLQQYTAEVVPCDDGSDDLMLVLPDELINEVGWMVGDTVKWSPNEDGSWSLTKQGVQNGKDS